MSTVKITELPIITSLDANTSNTLFVAVDRKTDITGQFTATTLSQGLYSNNPLAVGNNQILFPHTIAQFSGNSSTYLQSNFQNFTSTGSVDVVLTTNNGTDTGNYLDLGINNSAFSDPLYSSMNATDGYLYVSGPTSASYTGNLIIGTSSYGANINFIVGGTTSANIGAVFNEDWLTFKRPTIINQVPSSSSYDLFPALTINNTANGYSLLINDNLSDTTPFSIDKNGNTAVGSLSTSGYKFHVSGNTFFAGNVITSGVITFNDGSTFTSNDWISANDTATLTSAKSYTDTANTFLRANDATTLTSAKSYTDTANTYIQSNYLANTTGTFGGNLTISGNTNMSSYVTIANSTFNTSNAALISIIGSTGGSYVKPVSSGYMLDIVGVDGQPSRVINTSYGANTYGLFVGRHANGTGASPTAAANNDVLARFSGGGYTGTKFASAGQGKIDIVASENYSDANTGSRIEFWNSKNGSNTLVKIASFNAEDVVFTGEVYPQKGFIYTPNVISSNVTTFNIDIANNSLYKISCNASLTLSLSGFKSGKVVEVWLTNQATGGTQSITHGCSSLNSSINSTSFTIPTTSSAYLRYFSIDSDLANTYVSIQHG